MKNRKPTPFWTKVELDVPQGFQQAITAAAAKRYLKPAEYARMVLLSALESDGEPIGGCAA